MPCLFLAQGAAAAYHPAMSGAVASLILLGMFAFIGAIIWALVKRLRVERRQQDAAARTPVWKLVAVGVVVVCVASFAGIPLGQLPILAFALVGLVPGIRALRRWTGGGVGSDSD